MSEGRWERSSATAFRWLDASFSLPISFMRWPRLLTSYIPSRPQWIGLTPRRWSPQSWTQFLDFSIVDTMLWPIISAVESVALVSMLCFFFLFCGCTI